MTDENMVNLPEEISDKFAEKLINDCYCPLCGYDGIWPPEMNRGVVLTKIEAVKDAWRDFAQEMNGAEHG